MHALVCLGLLITALHFLPANLASFNFDDYKLIVENPALRELDLGKILASGRPVRALSYALDYQLFGLDPRGYHLVNVAWDCLACLLFYFLVFRLTGDILTAAAAAFLFAFHPIHTEAVMGIAHRKEMMAAVFLFLSLHAYLYRDRRPVAALSLSLLFFVVGLLAKQVVVALPLLLLAHEWVRKDSWQPRRLLRLWPWLAIPLILFVAGAAIYAPVLRDFNFLGLFSPRQFGADGYLQFLASAFREYPHFLRGLVAPVHLTVVPPIIITTWSSPGPWLGVACFAGLAAAAFLSRRQPLISFALFWILINLLPVMNLIPANTLYADRYLYIPSAGVCLLLALLLQAVAREPVPLLDTRRRALAMFLILVPVMFMVCAAQPIGRINGYWNHPEAWRMDRATGAAIGSLLAALPAALVVSALFGRRLGESLGARPWLQFPALYAAVAFFSLAALILANGFITGRFGMPDFMTEAKFEYLHQWVGAHARPGPRAGQSALFASGSTRAELANIFIFQFTFVSLVLVGWQQLGRRLERARPNAGLAVGLFMLVMTGCITGATIQVEAWASDLGLWRAAIMEDPGSLIGWNNLGKSYLDRRRYDRAASAFVNAARIAPDKPEPWRNLGMARLGLRDFKGAAEAYQRAAERDPLDTASLLNLANLLVVQADQGTRPQGYQEAIKHYSRVLEINPRSAHARNNMAYCFFKLGAYPQALEQARKALAISPDNPRARGLLGQIQAAMAQ